MFIQDFVHPPTHMSSWTEVIDSNEISFPGSRLEFTAPQDFFDGDNNFFQNIFRNI